MLGCQRLLCLCNTTWQLYPPLWTCSSIPCRSLCYFSSLTHWLAGTLSAKALLQECSGKTQHPGPSSGPTCSAGARAVLGIEPRTSRTLSENHATRPNSQLIEVARDPKNSLYASDTAPPAAERSGWKGRGAWARSFLGWGCGAGHTSTKPSVVQGILLPNLHPELLSNFTLQECSELPNSPSLYFGLSVVQP